jgi:competence protein ComGC
MLSKRRQQAYTLIQLFVVLGLISLVVLFLGAFVPI